MEVCTISSSSNREQPMNFNRGDFIKWSVPEQDIEHIGRFVEHTNYNMVIMQIQQRDGVKGVITIPDNDGTFELCKRPKWWVDSENSAWNNPSKTKSKKTNPTIVPPKADVPKKAKAKRTSGGKTKVDLIIELLGEDGGKTTRKEAITRIVDAGISTPAGASTFYNTAKKQMGW